jgi:hypothetical protein
MAVNGADLVRSEVLQFGLVEPKAKLGMILEGAIHRDIGGLGYDDHHLTAPTTGYGGAEPLGAREGPRPRLGDEIDRDPVYSDADR